MLPVTGWSSNTYLPNPYMEQYSASLQRQLAADMAIEVSYIGNVGRKLPEWYQYNPAVYRRWRHAGESGTTPPLQSGASRLDDPY